jgi:hypothetical protein
MEGFFLHCKSDVWLIELKEILERKKEKKDEQYKLYTNQTAMKSNDENWYLAWQGSNYFTHFKKSSTVH